ncbi:hypothetical protein [Stenotrophomonas sp. ESTM1D_MKCIP4_1]|uniref:hypothetical protein n=1 Tax=Stenotrophomonas sp. ESTM1D_MKCIP4_1 TaxID=2072414 RepID=UPI00157445AB|nr:hypothetical protein [Stenotrophomonas sp. ESTM1D_MKCIP4_1]
MTARAEPVASPLQIRLVVVAGCTDAPGTAAPCPAPVQYSDAATLPAQVRELAPSPPDDSRPALPEPPTVYY